MIDRKHEALVNKANAKWFSSLVIVGGSILWLSTSDMTPLYSISSLVVVLGIVYAIFG